MAFLSPVRHTPTHHVLPADWYSSTVHHLSSGGCHLAKPLPHPDEQTGKGARYSLDWHMPWPMKWKNQMAERVTEKSNEEDKMGRKTNKQWVDSKTNLFSIFFLLVASQNRAGTRDLLPCKMESIWIEKRRTEEREWQALPRGCVLALRCYLWFAGAEETWGGRLAGALTEGGWMEDQQPPRTAHCLGETGPNNTHSLVLKHYTSHLTASHGFPSTSLQTIGFWIDNVHFLFFPSLFIAKSTCTPR